MDDLIRILPFPTMQSAAQLHEDDNRDLDDSLGAAAYAQNAEQQEVILWWPQRGSARMLAAEIAKTSTILPAMKHLGAMREPGGSNAMEITMRIQAGNLGWCSLGVFWSPGAMWRIKRLNFIALVYAPTLSGVEALAVKASEVKRITRSLSKKLRCASGGTTTWDDEHPKAMSEAALWKLWQLAPPVIELTIRRLKMWQSIAAEPGNHQQLLAVFFGLPRIAEGSDLAAPMKSDGNICDEKDLHPWAIMLKHDIGALLSTEDAHELAEEWDENYKDLFTLDTVANDLFVGIDPKCLRKEGLTTKRAPEVVDALPDELNPPSADEEEGVYQCEIIHEGTRCPRKFGAIHAMRTHQRFSKLPGHCIRSIISDLCQTNMCINCKTAFKDTIYVRQHLMGAWATGRYIKGETTMMHEHEMNIPIYCKLCDADEERPFHEHEQYRQHAILHLPRSLLGSSINVVDARPPKQRSEYRQLLPLRSAHSGDVPKRKSQAGSDVKPASVDAARRKKRTRCASPLVHTFVRPIAPAYRDSEGEVRRAYTVNKVGPGGRTKTEAKAAHVEARRAVSAEIAARQPKRTILEAQRGDDGGEGGIVAPEEVSGRTQAQEIQAAGDRSRGGRHGREGRGQGRGRLILLPSVQAWWEAKRASRGNGRDEAGADAEGRQEESTQEARGKSDGKGHGLEDVPRSAGQAVPPDGVPSETRLGRSPRRSDRPRGSLGGASDRVGGRNLLRAHRSYSHGVGRGEEKE